MDTRSDVVGRDAAAAAAAADAAVAAQEMMAARPAVDFDTNPPMPVEQYAQTVRGVNVGYELLFTLTDSFLRARHQAALDLLVVGAGGGAEIERLLPHNPGWRLTGVDPSQGMLAQAQATAERLGVAERVNLMRGSVEDLPPTARFDAATCLFVLHFLPDEAKLALLKGTFRRLKPGAPLLVASGARIEADEALRDDFLGAWQQHGELMGMPPEQMAAIIGQLMARQAGATREDGYVRLLHEAGFRHVASLLQVMSGGMGAWIAR